MKTIGLILFNILFATICFATPWLVWDPPQADQQVLHHRIYRAQSQATNSPGILIGEVSGSTTSFDVADFISSNRNTFWVTAVNINGETAPSNKVNIQKN